MTNRAPSIGTAPPSLANARPHWLLLPALVWLGAFLLLPLAVMFAVSLAARGTSGGVLWTVSLANYAAVLDPLYLRVFAHSCLLAGLTTLICLLIGFPLAYFIARLPARRQGFWLLLVMVPFWTNFLVRTYAWIVLLRAEGLLNRLLVGFGIVDRPLEVLYTDAAVVIGLVYGYVPFMVLPLYVALERIPVTLVEAARDLYASSWAVARRVVWPLARPGVIAGSLLVFIPSLGAYVTPDLLGGARSMLIGNLVQHEFLVVRDWPVGSAVSFVLMAAVAGGLWGLMQAESNKYEVKSEK